MATSRPIQIGNATEEGSIANDLSRALVVVARIEAVPPVRMIEQSEIDAALSSFPHERVGAFQKRGTVAARAREKERGEIWLQSVERRHAGPFPHARVRR